MAFKKLRNGPFPVKPYRAGGAFSLKSSAQISPQFNLEDKTMFATLHAGGVIPKTRRNLRSGANTARIGKIGALMRISSVRFELE
jgi:hypothetical protein